MRYADLCRVLGLMMTALVVAGSAAAQAPGEVHEDKAWGFALSRPAPDWRFVEGQTRQEGVLVRLMPPGSSGGIGLRPRATLIADNSSASAMLPSVGLIGG